MIRVSSPIPPRSPACVLAAALLLPGDAFAVDVFTRDTFAPYTVNDVNALIGNHTFVQSMLALDRAPVTLGISNFQTRADWARSDGSVFRGALNRRKYLLSVGGGRPATGTAFFLVGNMDGIYAGPWPISLENATDPEDGHVRAVSFGAVGAAGVAHKGWVAQLAYFYHDTKMDSDALGRFTTCDLPQSCPDLAVRPGAPELGTPSSERVTVGNTMFTLENAHGYSAAVLLTPDALSEEQKTSIGSVRALAEPWDLLPAALGILGLGFTTYGAGLDYYGDRTEQTQAAIDAGEPAPEPAGKGIVEFPFTAQRIGATGATARIVLQASPLPAFRLAEAGYFYEGPQDKSFVPSGGARAKLFRRDTGYVPSADAYAGFFWTFDKAAVEAGGRGLSAYATYCYNSPDAANLVPLANAHIFGLQVVFGNPAALPPPSSLIRYPAWADGGDP